MKEEGKDNDLLERIAGDSTFHLSLEELEERMNPAAYTGRASIQTETYIRDVINPLLEEHQDLLGVTAEICV